MLNTRRVSEVTYYRWRQEFGGLKTEQVKRLKDLELENSRLVVAPERPDTVTSFRELR